MIIVHNRYAKVCILLSNASAYLINLHHLLGPYQVNGVPLRRIPQSYVVATKTKLNLGSLKVDKELRDDFFKRQKSKKKRGDDMFEQSVEVI